MAKNKDSSNNENLDIHAISDNLPAKKPRLTDEELFAMQAVLRGCNTNSKLRGSIYVQNFGTEQEKEITYFDAVNKINALICEELRLRE